MIHSTRGIVLKTVKYSENSIIAKIYTENFGLRSYIVKGVSGKKSHRWKALLQGLTLLDMVVYEKPSSGLQHIKEISSAYSFHYLPFDIRKSTIAMFLNEIIYKAIGEESANQALFSFVSQSIINLDRAQTKLGIFHLYFLIGFSQYLGFLPRNNCSKQNPLFDMQEGAFVSQVPQHSNYMDEKTSLNFSRLILDTQDFQIDNHEQRNALLEKIIEYYSLHLPAFGEVKSYSVLQQIFKNE
jgi:DNA repair protein RecO (recombination protein O)